MKSSESIIEKKYQFTNEPSLFWQGHNLKAIVSLRDFGDIKKGDLGGYIESEKNLSHEGNSWVYPEGKVGGGASVIDNAQVIRNFFMNGNAIMRDNSTMSGEHTLLGENATLNDKSRMSDSAVICGNACLKDHSQASNHSHISGDVVIENYSHVSGFTILSTDWQKRGKYLSKDIEK